VNNDDSKNFDWTRFASETWSASTIGDSIAGQVVGLDVKDGRNGPVPVVTLQIDANGTRREVWAGAADLKAQFAALRPEIGTFIAIKYTADRPVGKASPMKIFEVTTPKIEDNGELPF
jgi:hypothetical protein